MRKSRSASSDFSLSKRDLEILSSLEKWGVLGLGQIEGLLFGGGANTEKRIELFFNRADRQMYRRYPYKRLFRLERAGLIRTIRFLKYPQFYCLSEAGHRALRRHGRARCEGFTRSISGDFLRHEVSVNGVGLILQECFGLRVSTERERVAVKRLARLPHNIRLVLSDLWVVDATCPKAIEIERSKKSAAQYRKIWDAYKERMLEGFPGGSVIYLTMDVPRLGERLLEYARRWDMDFLYFAPLEDFRSTGGRCRFVGAGDGNEFAFEPGAGSILSPSPPERKGE